MTKTPFSLTQATHTDQAEEEHNVPEKTKEPQDCYNDFDDPAMQDEDHEDNEEHWYDEDPSWSPQELTMLMNR